MKTPHKHCQFIKAWAEGIEIEVRTNSGWSHIGEHPAWAEMNEYRIKPEPKPDIVMYCYTDKTRSNRPELYFRSGDNTKLTFDGETGKLKSAEVIS